MPKIKVISKKDEDAEFKKLDYAKDFANDYAKAHGLQDPKISTYNNGNIVEIIIYLKVPKATEGKRG